MEKEFVFNFGEEQVRLALPRKNILYEIEGRSVSPISQIPTAIRAALQNPIDSPPLNQVVQAGDKVCIVVSDITRGWINTGHFLPVLLDEINGAGVPDSDIFIMVALGSHRPHTAAENVTVCGQDVRDRVRIYHHNCLDNDNLVYVGTTSRGVKTYLNRRVVEADKVILTGGIIYHAMAGFSGGGKSITPGVSGEETIQGNHAFCMHPEMGRGINPLCTSGRTKGNPMREDLMEQTAFLNPAFLLNAVYTAEGKFAKFMAGHWRTAWEAGCREVERIFGIPVSAQADLVIASAGGYPKDINLYQGVKTIDNAVLAAKPGGIVICFLECRDIQEPREFSDWFNHRDLPGFEMALRKHFTVPGFLAFKCAAMARQVSIIIVTRPENTDFIRKTGMIPATSAAEALGIAHEKLGRDNYTITVMTHGAGTVPVLRTY
jgi:nickel-dependent lactate racemase